MRSERGTELYDLEADVSERDNLAEENPDVVESLQAKLGAIIDAAEPR